MTGHLLQVDNVSKEYLLGDGEVVQALTDVTLEIGKGEFVALVGPSGCGKSTLLSILAGLSTVTTGDVEYESQPHLTPRPDIGVMFQTPVLLPWRTIRQNVMLPAEILKLDRAVYRERASELIRVVGLEGFEGAYPGELSGGMAQRAALCRLLAPNPDILLMDEPFGALDEFTREALDLELLRIWEDNRKTIVFVTHNIEESVFLADRIVVMSPRPGRISKIVAPELSRPRERSMMREREFIDAVFEIRGALGVAA